ncbi:UPF0149 family protein [uncultured Paracoccus sp.]|uniref:UPF0149 family protein n=1 Tax=uncultured Paracoccus sp. TaxID=189685 RepID=UPI002628DF91|nr:UPF0149 family protein [uncultured Paracoccus sp.]
MSSEDNDLDHLDALLAALPQERCPMTVSELDGYLTGILSCPDLIPPSEWLPHVWGEASATSFPDQELAGETASAVMAHYSSLASRLLQEPWIEPVYEIDQNSNETLWEPWVDGFTRALRLRPELWLAVLERSEGEARSSLIFLMALQEINEGTSKFSDAEIDEIDLEAPDLIPDCVAAILLATRPELAGSAANEPHAPLQ